MIHYKQSIAALVACLMYVCAADATTLNYTSNKFNTDQYGEKVTKNLGDHFSITLELNIGNSFSGTIDLNNSIPWSVFIAGQTLTAEQKNREGDADLYNLRGSISFQEGAVSSWDVNVASLYAGGIYHVSTQKGQLDTALVELRGNDRASSYALPTQWVTSTVPESSTLPMSMLGLVGIGLIITRTRKSV